MGLNLFIMIDYFEQRWNLLFDVKFYLQNVSYTGPNLTTEVSQKLINNTFINFHIHMEQLLEHFLAMYY